MYYVVPQVQISQKIQENTASRVTVHKLINTATMLCNQPHLPKTSE